MSPRAYPDEPRRPRRRGCLRLITVLLSLGVCGGLGVGFVNFMGGEPAEIEIPDSTLLVNGQPYTAPINAAANQSFTLQFDIRNRDVGDPSVTVQSVGLDETLREDLTVTQITVNGTPVRIANDGQGEDKNYPFFGNWRDYALNRDLAQNETITVALTLLPTQSGEHRGDLLIWVEGSYFGVPLARARRIPLELNVQ